MTTFMHGSRCAATRQNASAHRQRRAVHLQRHAPTHLTLPAAPRVLHIDCHEGTALVLDTLLMPQAQVTHADSVVAARRLLRQGRYALVVIDPLLADGDGAELLPLLAATPVLVYSSHYPAWGAQAQAFLPKRVTPYGQLFGVLAYLLELDGLALAAEAS